MEKFMDIGSRREVFWDDEMVDLTMTTAEFREHSLVERGPCFVCSEPYDGGESKPIVIVPHDGGYRMYYEAYNMYPNGKDAKRDFMNRRTGVLDSKDGIEWSMPVLNEVEYAGSTANNLSARPDPKPFIENADPDAPADERYVTVGYHETDRTHNTLYVRFSADAVTWRDGYPIVTWKKQCFDSDNKIVYNKELGRYQVFFRAFHGFEDRSGCWWDSHKMGLRDIRLTESEDLVHWSEPRLLDFGEDANDYALYTNNISFYYRAPHIMYGLPTRYTERNVWSDAYDRLCGRDDRLDRMKEHPRYGFDLTDGMFMCSRDGYHWKRNEEPIATGGAEYAKNWIYGDCFFCQSMIETPARFPGQDNELSLYASDGDWIYTKSSFIRYTIRIDGFASRHAGARTKILMTKPFRFTGTELEINFATSAAGYVQVTLCDRNGHPFEGYQSAFLFGNKIDRKVDFREPLDFFGKYDIPVRIRFEMAEADIYSFKFN